ncbi:acyl-CoA dehydrogenase family protein [Dactylosporangium sp. NPDC051484]|uniref:acyl-CoA dehydrogenase family protein n=1 Tax=Dactylosporangium sp. NPDC051484 TaxID=3154942 RepID=UPI00344C33AB
MTATPTTDPADRLRSVSDRLRPILVDIAEGAVEREIQRELPYAAVESLRAAGFASLRVPVEQGGGGLSFTELIDVLIELARADSNLPQLLRGHIGFVEHVLATPKMPARDFWISQLVTGALIGNAVSERTGNLSEPDTRIVRAGDGWTITGTKYYSTGSIFADWIFANGFADGRYATALVPARSPEVRRDDDWDGFGQRLTGSGTTVFADAPVQADHVALAPTGLLPLNTRPAIFQLVLLATLAGIAQAVRDDAVAFVRQRSRSGHGALVELPRYDPQIQQVVGEIAGYAHAATAAVHESARAIEKLQVLEQRESATDADYAAADAAVFLSQGPVIDLTLRAATELFRACGASATSQSRALDRHWRNARTIATHNPEVFRARALGNHLLNDGSLSMIGFTPHVEPRAEGSD